MKGKYFLRGNFLFPHLSSITSPLCCWMFWNFNSSISSVDLLNQQWQEHINWIFLTYHFNIADNGTSRRQERVRELGRMEYQKKKPFVFLGLVCLVLEEKLESQFWVKSFEKKIARSKSFLTFYLTQHLV